MNVDIRVIGPKEYPPNLIPKWEIYGGVPYKVFNTTSRGANKDLSPFYLGPVNLYGDWKSKNVENAWQYSKVYPQFYDDKVLPEYWEWAISGWSQKYANRYPMGKGSIPLFSYWDGNELGYVEARKKIYVPLYSDEVVKTKSYQDIVNTLKSGQSVSLWDFDGYDHKSLNMSLDDVLNCGKKKMGHAFVIAILCKLSLQKKNKTGQ